MVKPSRGEQEYLFHVKAAGLPIPLEEYRFHPTRRWRFDFAWPGHKIAVEIEGVTSYGKNANGTIRLGRHQTAKGYEKDTEKYNEALILGWRVLRFSTGQVTKGIALEMTERLFNAQ